MPADYLSVTSALLTHLYVQNILLCLHYRMFLFMLEGKSFSSSSLSSRLSALEKRLNLFLLLESEQT